MLNTKMVVRALDIPLTPPNPIEFQPITQTEATEWFELSLKTNPPIQMQC